MTPDVKELLELADEMEAAGWKYEAKGWDVPPSFLRGWADEIRRMCGGEEEDE